MADKGSEGVDWNGVSEPMVRQILHQAETYMHAQWKAALAADQRAVITASILVAVAVALAGSTLAYWNSNKNALVLVVGLGATTMLVLAAAICSWSARPTKFYAPGNLPEQWWPVRTGDLITAIGGETENYQTRIEWNERVLSANARLFSIGLSIALAVPVLALLVWPLFLL